MDYIVKSIKYFDKGGFEKQINLKPLTNNKNQTENIHFKVPLSSAITTGETVRVNEENNISSICKNGSAKILPRYRRQEYIKFGNTPLSIVIKQITSDSEFSSYKALTQYHYRDKKLFGRRSPLIACTSHPLLPKVIGYIELASPFFVNKPRKDFFNTNIKVNGVTIDGWNFKTAKNYIQLFVRIARCVVHPEIRSSGLGKLLVSHAAKFAQSYWQLAGWKPYFMEISADMLRYVPFAEKAGMVYLGDTEGNIHRIKKDLDYFSRNMDRIKNEEILSGHLSGILDSKLSKFRKTARFILQEEGIDLNTLLEYHLKHPTLKGWSLLKDVIALPKPHFIMGLNSHAKKAINKRMKYFELPISPTKGSNHIIIKAFNARLKKDISFIRVKLEFPFRIRRNSVTHEVERAFEISLDKFKHLIFKDLSIEIKAGKILLVSGLSGSGKSMFLKLITGEIKKSSGQINIPKQAKIGLLEVIKSKKSLIEVVGRGDASKGIYWLNRFGLSEPNLYLKPYFALSDGQKYRAMLANLLASNNNVWIIDNFCENLDLINAKNIAHQVHKLSKETGSTVIVASTSPQRFIDELNPDRVIIMKGITNEVDFVELKNTTNSELIG